MEGLASIKNQLIGGLGSIISYLNPNSDMFILKPVIEGLTNIKNMFQTLLNYFNPFSETFFLKVAFIPQSPEYDLKKQELIDAFKNKFLFYGNIIEVLNQIKNLGTGSAEPPTFDVEMPQKYGGDTYSIIDFSYFADYRIFILNFQRCIMWFFFIKGIFRSLPKTTSLQG